MFETITPNPLKASASPAAAAALRTGRFPLELEHEFAEMQASVPSGGTLPALLGSALLFHGLLIAERTLLVLPPRMFAMRGGPVTLLLLAYFLLPATFRKHESSRAFLVLFSMMVVAALLAGIPFAGAGQLLPLQTGIAVLMLLLGWLTALPRSWTLLTVGGTLLADAVFLLAGPAVHSAGLPVILESFWGPVCAAMLLILSASVRHSESRREFLLLRQAAFAGIQGGAAAEPAADNRHLDPQTGVASRPAFEMRFRAAWDNAATRRSSVALLFFSIDNLPETKRDLGFKSAELLQTQVAGLLKESLRRADDMVARYDQHHFVVMLPGVGVDGSAQIGERLRGSIEEMAFYAGQKRYKATVTVGTASMRAKRGTPREKLADAAVAALEQARATGQNTVCVDGRGCLPRMS